MTRTAPLPADLAGCPPGPRLGSLLAALDVTAVPNDRIVEVLRAESRQLAHQHAPLFAAIAEVGRCERLDVPGEVARAAAPSMEAIQEVGPALTWTSNATFAEHDVAEELRVRVPEVQSALLAGLIDRPEARVLVDWTRDLTARQTARVLHELLPVAPRLTTGQLVDRLRRRLKSLDPEALRKRYERAVRCRSVSGYLHRDGTATITASGLSPEEAASSCERVWELARTIRRAGHPGSLAQIRADLFVALLDGSLQQMTNAQIVLAMLARRSGSAVHDGPETVAGSAPTPGTGDPAADEGPAPGVAVVRESAGPAPATGPTPAEDVCPDTAESLNGEEAGPAGAPAPGPTGADSAATSTPGEEPRPGIDVRVRVSTLLGLDEHPGEIPGWGVVLPHTARCAVARQRAGRWRFAITDADGHLLLAGATRLRPEPADEVRQSCGGTVELQIPLPLLRRLAAEPPAGWAALVADLAAQYARRAELLAELRADPTARFPHAALRRHVEVRDRTCVFPGCRRPAARVQMDHTVEHQHGGPTVDTNLGPLCVLHHALKSAGGWRLAQPHAGRFHWWSSLGCQYWTRAEPIAPPVQAPDPDDEPDPDEEPRRLFDDDRAPEFGLRTLPHPRPPPPSPAAAEPDDEEPPF